jgi:hypothetical protein
MSDEKSMNDIVERLRSSADCAHDNGFLDAAKLEQEAADEIEQLIERRNSLAASFAKAAAEIERLRALLAEIYERWEIDCGAIRRALEEK